MAKRKAQDVAEATFKLFNEASVFCVPFFGQRAFVPICRWFSSMWPWPYRCRTASTWNKIIAVTA
ncbi:hypothetical protein, partial [Hydrogenimonas sp.]|uniref:hypothetical protein n=1 Tax=Hydrogenimonas sp. TaxID=2231112 RepID=UPI002620C257